MLIIYFIRDLQYSERSFAAISNLWFNLEISYSIASPILFYNILNNQDKII